MYPVVSPRTGWYLAGIADGEGCFAISQGNNDQFRCEFIIHMRDDDRPLLVELQSDTGLGYVGNGNITPINGSHPSCRWVVANRVDCRRLIEIFTEYPLRGKKAKDFAVWATAVGAWCRSDWRYMGELYHHIRVVRQYEAGDEPEIPDPDQMSLLEAA